MKVKLAYYELISMTNVFRIEAFFFMYLQCHIMFLAIPKLKQNSVFARYTNRIYWLIKKLNLHIQTKIKFDICKTKIKFTNLQNKAKILSSILPQHWSTSRWSSAAVAVNRLQVCPVSASADCDWQRNRQLHQWSTQFLCVLHNGPNHVLGKNKSQTQDSKFHPT